MKAMILAGGRGTRISEESQTRPKPMIEIGGMPILWHILKIYAAHGIREFVICLGYKGYIIKDFFANYLMHRSDLTIDLRDNRLHFHDSQAEDWSVTLVETGEDTETGGRVRRAARYLGDDDDFCLTYGDGVGDIDISAAIAFHKGHGGLATVTGVQPPGRFGALDIQGEKVGHFLEKPRGDGAYINGGFFVLSRKVIDYIASDATVWEREPLERLAAEGQLSAYRHDGFWQPMDTLRDKTQLEQLWATGKAPWRVW
ncbi:glucose-1-phosphate cytidylyltransferase [Asticcacaulis biprosthecium C19]|uniref:Glucose-1-phosphate cytidylyltransferase n=1 Tax=Asticcacaulis biprosthecium C19 TaxID=715226 RepID=F4QRQ7_9CAUL|nr:glucose-1-phosphate cytidylyltransferase [Asticcacaulis biprosthecium]EGF89427.1 glucose-1-phosphate cytidylyltransferase [Asticcacaulis biprosthecium C19]